MRTFRPAFVAVLLIASFGVAHTPAAQDGPFKVNYQKLGVVAVRMATHAASFRLTLKTAVLAGFLHDAPIGTYMISYAEEFGDLANRLNQRIKEQKPVSSETQEMLNRAEYIHSFMISYALDAKAQGDWRNLRTDLDELASYYQIKTHWNTPLDRGLRPEPIGVEAAENRLIGTYKLEGGRKNEVRDMVKRNLLDLPTNIRVRLQITLMRHLMDSQLVALDREGGVVKFASSLQPAKTYEVVGRAQTPESERVPTVLFGNQFRINTGSDEDGLYSITFGSTNLGSKLQVIRTAMLTRFKRPIVVSSEYTKISDAAEFDLPEDDQILVSPKVNGKSSFLKKN